MKKLLSVLITLLIFSFPVMSKRQQETDTAEYPSKSIEIVVPWSPGGNSDTFARAMMSVIGSYIDQPVAIINKPGAGGTIGTTYALNQKADGYTLLMTAWGPFVTQPHLNELQYGEGDYVPVMQVGFSSRVLCAHPDVPVNSMEELVAYAKDHPGEIKAGVASIGSTGHLAIEELKLMEGIDINVIPQDGGGGAKVAVLGNHVDIAALDLNIASDLVANGQLKPLGVTDSVRNAKLGDVPTCEEQGYPIISGVATHIYVPAGTPEDRINYLRNAFKSVMEDEAFISMAKRLNFNIVYKDSAAATEQINTISSNYGNIINKLGLSAK